MCLEEPCSQVVLHISLFRYNMVFFSVRAFYFSIFFIYCWIQFIISFQTRAPHFHSERRNVAKRQNRKCEWSVRAKYLFSYRNLERRQCQILCVHCVKYSYFANLPNEKGHNLYTEFLSSTSTSSKILDILIACYCQLPSLYKVFIFVYERVDSLQMLRLF